MTLLARHEWRVAQLRLTAFPAVPATGSEQDWWASTTGEEPDAVTANPKKATTIVSGAFGEGKLSLEVQPARIDWRLDPNVSLESLLFDPRLPDVSHVDEAMNPFADAVRRWLAVNSVPEVMRLAFGAVLQHPVSNRAVGYEYLPQYIPVRVDPASQDFLYQINYPIASNSLPDVTINRLSKWSVSRLSLMRRVSTADFTTLQASVPAELYALRLEVDINNVAVADRALPRDRLIPFFDELCQCAEGIIDGGAQLP